MEKNRTVDQATAEAYASSVGAIHFNTSAKLNRGIEDMFLDLSKRASCHVMALWIWKGPAGLPVHLPD